MAITCGNGGPSYAALSKTRERITLGALGIAETRVRRAVTGGLLIEIPGADMASKSDILADKFREVFTDEEVRISHHP